MKLPLSVLTRLRRMVIVLAAASLTGFVRLYDAGVKAMTSSKDEAERVNHCKEIVTFCLHFIRDMNTGTQSKLTIEYYLHMKIFLVV